jgi:5-methyltetrahydrofolate corrinoid/iron sulfur protein methyltransferase
VIVVAENLTVTDPVVARALAERDADPLRALAATAEKAGAQYLDVNLGPGSPGGVGVFEFVLDALSGHWGRGLLIDTTQVSVMEAAARRASEWPGPMVLNGYSGDPGRRAVLDLAARYGLDLVVFLMAGGIPRALEERLALAAELVADCRERGLGLDRLWLDPVVAPLGWIDGQARNADLIDILRGLPEVLGGACNTIVGLSNLTTGAAGGRRVPWLEEVFLAHAAGAGLTHAMVNVKNEGLVRVARALEVFEGRRLFAPQELLPLSPN